MIKTKEDLIEYIQADNSWYHPVSNKERVIDRLTSSLYRDLKSYTVLLRKCEYHLNNASGSRYHTYLYWIYEGKKNRLGRQLGIEIGPNCFGKGLNIWHSGIVVNPEARIGENCTLHGGNCIGNNGENNENPVLGNNVDIGFGAVVIGNITIADNIKIGANAVVNKSIEKNDSVVVGVPAKIIR